MLQNEASRKLGAKATMRLVIFSVAYVKRVRNGDTTQLKRELRKYQDVGRFLLLRSLCTHWFSRHVVILAT